MEKIDDYCACCDELCTEYVGFTILPRKTDGRQQTTFRNTLWKDVGKNHVTLARGIPSEKDIDETKRIFCDKL